MFKFFSIKLFLFYSIISFSQNVYIDSLETELIKQKQDNYVKAKILHEIAISYFNNQNYETAIKYFKNSIDIYMSKGDSTNAAFGLEYLGHAYSDINKFNDALFNYNQALTLYKSSKNESNVAGCLCNIGILYAEKTNILPAALKYYNEALDISNKIKDSLTMLKTLNNIGNLYMLNQNNEKAIEYFEKSLLMQKQTGYSIFLGITLNNIGNIYKNQQNYKKALLCLNESVTKSKLLNDKYTEGTSLNNIGEIFQNLGNYELAINYFKQGKSLMEELKNDYGLHNSLIGLGYCFSNLNKHKLALEFANKANDNAKQFDVVGLKRDVYGLFYSIFKKNNNYDKALKYHEEFKKLNDSIFNKEKIEKIIQLELEYKYKQTLDSAKYRELNLTKTVKTTTQDLEKSRRNILLTFIAFLIIAIVLVIIIFNLKLRNQKTITQNIVIEQELLRSQMTPHFVFNSLSVLQGMILNKEENKSINYLSKFSKLFRLVLENSREKLVLLSKELEAIEHYLTLQNFEDNAFDFKININESLKITQFKIPPMIIQPFVENVIEHAFESNIIDKKIEINLTLVEDKLSCTIIDNGIGIDASKVKNSKNKKSLATIITKERLEILSKDIKMNCSIKIEDRKIYNEQGTKVVIEIPYKIVEIS